MLGLVALPWAAANLVLARRASGAGQSMPVAVGALVVLMVLQLAVPETLTAVRAAALFFFASHAHV